MKPCAVLLMSVGLCGSYVSPAWAQPPAAESSSDDLIQARALFNEGLDLARQGRYRASAERFRSALAIRESPAAYYNLAQALAELDENVEAFRLATVVSDDDSAPASVREQAELLRDSLSPRVGRLRVTVGVADDQPVELLLDNEPIPSAQLGQELVVAPGSHVVESFQNGESLSRREVEIPPGSIALVDLSVVGGTASVVQAEDRISLSPSREPLAVESSGPSTGVWVALGLGAAALIAAVVVIAILVSSGGTEDPIDGNLSPSVLRWD